MTLFIVVGVPGIVGEFIVKERCEKLRSLLTVQGCSAVAYWCGSLLGDSTVLSIGLVVSENLLQDCMMHD